MAFFFLYKWKASCYWFDCKLFNQSGSENLNLDSNVFNSNRTGSRVSKLFSLSQLKQFLYQFESIITSGITKTVKPKI